jgi:hypothetical protein
MFQDSLSEGHLYYGRFVAIIAAAILIAVVVPHIPHIL